MFYVYILLIVFVLIFYYIFVFDEVIIGVGNVYYFYMGIFIVFKFGFYVFIWLIRCIENDYYLLELLVDNNIVSVIYLNLGNIIDGIVIGIVVVYVD